MHMADALISPAVGGTLWAGSGLAVAYAARKLGAELDDKKIPLMGVMGACIFSAQMINFAIPGTGSSGHIGGGVLLAVLLGPYAGFLTLASVLLIQALIFADGGLLAFGCNLFNMGVYACFVAYPLIYRLMTKKDKSKGRLTLASVLSVTAALQLGAFSVALETFISGKTELPFKTFVLLMQPIHLAIGLAEGFVTAAVILFLRESRPDLIGAGDAENRESARKTWSLRKVIAVLAIAALVTGGVLSLLASNHPDGLEWSIEKITGSTGLSGSGQSTFDKIQKKTAILPDYQFPEKDGKAQTSTKAAAVPISGIAGSVMTLGLTAAIALGIAFFKKRKDPHSRKCKNA